MKRISVIIPMYNVAPYLRRCLDSVCAAARGLDVEMLVVDDGSTDSSWEVLETYRRERASFNIRTFRQANAGQGMARNVGLDHMTGDYVLFVDSDDWIPAWSLGRFLEVAEASGSALVASVGMYRDSIPASAGPTALSWRMHDSTWVAGRRKIQYAVWNKLYRAEILKDRRFLPGSYEDFAFITNLFCDIDAFAVVNEKLYVYCYNQGAASTMRSDMSARKEQDSFRMLRSVLEHGTKTPRAGFAMRQCADGIGMTINKLWRGRGPGILRNFIDDYTALTRDFPGIARKIPLKSRLRLWWLRRHDGTSA